MPGQLSTEGPSLIDPETDTGHGVVPRKEGEDGGQHEGSSSGFCSVRLPASALLVIFIYVNLLNYMDRGIVNGVLPEFCVNCQARHDRALCQQYSSCMWEDTVGHNGTCSFNSSVVPRRGIAGSFHINETAQGVLAGSFMGGYCVFSPIFAHLSTIHAPFRLMGLGLTAWCIACALGTMAPTYNALLTARILSGIGEASFQCIAPCFIDDMATASQKGKWLAAFFMAVPIGQALGYTYGGYMCSQMDPERIGFAGWRMAFALEGIAMVPVAISCFFISNRLRKKKPDQTSLESEGSFLSRQDSESRLSMSDQAQREEYTILKSLKTIIGSPIWLCTVMGYGAFTFSVGAMAVWGPTYLQRKFEMQLDDADLAFGSVAVFTGLFGTISGGIILDLVTKVLGRDAMSNSLLVSATLVTLAWPCCFLAFSATEYRRFILFMIVGQFLAFATTSPVNGVLLWCVPAEVRTLSMALSVVGIHVLGDVPSPVVVGAMLERFQDEAFVMQVVSCWIGWCILCWGIAYVLSVRSHRHRKLLMTTGGDHSTLPSAVRLESETPLLS